MAGGSGESMTEDGVGTAESKVETGARLTDRNRELVP